MQNEVILNGKKITLIGTAHISQESITEVENVIQELQPDTVCVELDPSRYEALNNKDRWKNLDIVKVIKTGKAPLLIANLILMAFQKKMGDQLGVTPGAEMVAAITKAKEAGSEIVLADRDVTITLKRAWRALSLWERAKLMVQLLGAMVSSPKISKDEVENLKEGDMLTEAIESMAKELPGIKTVLIDERDRYLSTKIAQAPGDTIVAVVGAGHMPGILKHLESPVDLAELEILPKPGHTGTFLKWGLPMSIIAIIIYGFFGLDTDVSMEMMKRWILANGILAALGALLAGGHIVTVIVAFIAAPITSLNPAIAAGWVAGLTEAWIRKPKVEDFEKLPTDITSFRGFRRNEITKILMVVILSNLGSSIGTFIGIPLLTSLL